MLRLALQSKGRLNEESLALLSEIGIKIDDSKRKFLTKSSSFPIEVLYLRDDDIPQVVFAGTSQLGIVGLNEVEEKGFKVKVISKLGFGGCRISLAIPKGEEYDGPQWFNGKTIATSYPNILKKYLKKNNISARIEVITGSVEIAPAAGISDAIFDIVSSGGTLVSNGLKEVERVFESEAVLIGNGNFSPEEKENLDEMLFRIESVKASRGKQYILMNLPQKSIDKALEILPSMRSPTVLPLAASGWCSLHSVVDKKDLWEKIKALKAIGAEGILVLGVDKIIA